MKKSIFQNIGVFSPSQTKNEGTKNQWDSGNCKVFLFAPGLN